MGKVRVVGDIVEYEGTRVAWLLPQKACDDMGLCFSRNAEGRIKNDRKHNKVS